ncbi:MAG: OmpA family protein [Pseudomonadota bacterium]
MGRSGQALTALLCALAGPAPALDLPQNARQTASRDSALDQVSIAVGPYLDGAVPMQTAEGPVTRRAYRLPAPGLTPLQILAPLRAQLAATGHEVLLDCDEDACGGFDFRFAIEVLPAPNMYVNIRAYHFLSATGPGGAVISLLASTAPDAGYLQVIEVGGAAPTTRPTPTPTPDAATPTPTDLATRILAQGHAVLRSIDFTVGTTTLDPAAAPDLAALAQMLQDRPGLRIAVVGHTDTVGDLDTNIAVSRARAQAVRTALIDTYGAPGDRIEAEGMGYLAPIASNLTAAGRTANRRVEVIVVADTGG